MSHVCTSALTLTDLFCGAGGSSLGASRAGAEIALALNHWNRALETHATNFPHARHECVDIRSCEPRRYPRTRGLLASPSCTNHSIAKGKQRKGLGRPTLFDPSPTIDAGEELSRSTMFDVIRFTEIHEYDFMIVENVVDVRHWLLFDDWLRMMMKLGYEHELVYYNSMFAYPIPIPQSRDRLYMVFWRRELPAPDLRFTPPSWCSVCDKQVEAVQSWKQSTRKWGRYGRTRQYLYRCPTCAHTVVPRFAPASQIIDWSLPMQRIGDRTRPLKATTLHRIEQGLRKLAAASPAEPRPFVLSLSYGHETERCVALDEALMTQTTRQDQALVVPAITQFNAHCSMNDIEQPLSTITAQGNHHALTMVPSYLLSYYSNGGLSSTQEPMGTVTTRDRHALITAEKASPSLDECFFRMLSPAEIGRGMGFPDSYVVEGTAKDKVRQYGNAVTPGVMEMLVSRCAAIV